jgi:integrating conjugative element protein (TIGR03749 family)
VTWERAPLAIALTVGEERMLNFRAPVSIGVPVGLEPLLRTQTVNGTVYLLANSQFPAARLIVRELDGGQVYLLDVTATEEGGRRSAVAIIIDEVFSADRGSQANDGRRHVGYVTLTRYAAKQLYVPLRLLSSEPGIVRQAVRQEPVRLVPGASVTATPLAAWRAGSLYVTAVKLTNRRKTAQVLDPRTLKGKWLAATFQHGRLLPAGDEADTTAVYLVSAQPFEASL